MTRPKVTLPKVTRPKVTRPKVTCLKVTPSKVTRSKVTRSKETSPKVTCPKVTRPKVQKSKSPKVGQQGEVEEVVVHQPAVSVQTQVVEPRVEEVQVTMDIYQQPKVTSQLKDVTASGASQEAVPVHMWLPAGRPTLRASWLGSSCSCPRRSWPSSTSCSPLASTPRQTALPGLARAQAGHSPCSRDSGC